MIIDLALAYVTEADFLQAKMIAAHLNLIIDNKAKNKLLIKEGSLYLCIPPFLPLTAQLTPDYWLKRHHEGSKQGLIRACRPQKGISIIDATAGWGRDAALLASFGSSVLMLERHPILALLLQDGLKKLKDSPIDLSMLAVDAIDYLAQLSPHLCPDVIYLDPMHPERKKSSLVKKDLQVLQKMIGPDEDAYRLIQIAQQKAKQKVVVKWPQNQPPLITPNSCVEGKTVRFDVYLPVCPEKRP